ncbi:unnamed protein product, partial [Iphiclides podalirius]
MYAYSLSDQKICLTDFNDYEDATQINVFTREDHGFTPVNTLSKDNEKLVATKNINCDDFQKYVYACTADAALMYNSSRKVPPMPNRIPEWCSAMRHLTNCATDWNSDCRDVTESHFYEESIKGHMHVVNNDTSYSLSALKAQKRLGKSATRSFKEVVDDKKNTSHEWTHYETHFYLCCARAQFRRCTLELLFETANKCTNVQAVILQKFSVIISEGDVFQDCDVNVMYANCPDGDPRPNDVLLSKLVMVDDAESEASNAINWKPIPFYACVQLFINGLHT